jgi:hypothetical protein
MDDIETRLGSERPEVADALKSMNWEERLEQARARRRVVLDGNTAADKRPVVRIIDAAAVARRRAESTAPVAPAAPKPPVPLIDPLPSRAVETPALKVVHPSPAITAPSSAEAEESPARKPVSGRLALGFAAGLGMGIGLVAGAVMLLGFARPDAPPSATPPAVAATAPTPSAADLAPVAFAGAPAAPAVLVGEPVSPTLPERLAAAIPRTDAPVAPATEPADTIPGAATAPPAPPSPATAPVAGVEPPRTFAALTETETADAPLLAAATAVPAALSAPAALGTLALETSLALPAGPATPAADASAPAAPTGPAPEIAALVPAMGAGPLAPLRPAPPAPPGADAAPRPDPASPDLLMAAADPAVMATPPAHRPVPSIPGAEALSLRLVTPRTVPEAEANALLANLTAMGIEHTRVTPVGFKVSETHVRYYHREDAAAAAALAEALGTEARDHTAFRPRPPDGTLEVFLAGQRAAAPARAVAANHRAAAPTRAVTNTRAAAQPPRQARPADDGTVAIRERILNRMRRGEHL